MMPTFKDLGIENSAINLALPSLLGDTLILNCQSREDANAAGAYLGELTAIALQLGCCNIAMRVGQRKIMELPVYVILQLWERKLMNGNR